LEQALRHHSDDAEHHGHSDQQEKALRVTSRWEKLVGHVRSRRFPQHPPVRPRYRGRIPWPHTAGRGARRKVQPKLRSPVTFGASDLVGRPGRSSAAWLT
jgi:hypothetical protein